MTMYDNNKTNVNKFIVNMNQFLGDELEIALVLPVTYVTHATNSTSSQGQFKDWFQVASSYS